MRSARCLLFPLLFLINPACGFAQSRPDTVRVYFGLNRDEVSAQQQARLDSLQYLGRLLPGQWVQLIGYCDYVGGESYNDDLSRRRARQVQRYLLASGFRKDRIVLITGNGEIARPGAVDNSGHPPDRRVDIVIGAAPAADIAPVPEQPVARTDKPAMSGVKLTEVKVNETLLLDKIHFYPARHIPLQSSLPALEGLYEQLRDNPAVRIGIEGHICCPVSPYPAEDAMDIDTRELQLSRNRARYVSDFLVQRGIAPDRLSYKGFAFTNPVVPVEVSAADEEKNRRVEIRILSK